jgi:hypothetical protein
MRDKDLFKSSAERRRNVGDKQVIVDQFEKEFKESSEEYTKLIASTRQLSFTPGKSKKILFQEKFKECIKEFLEIEQFRDWALNMKNNEWNDIQQLILRDKEASERDPNQRAEIHAATNAKQR